jgi:hypothetical protein
MRTYFIKIIRGDRSRVEIKSWILKMFAGIAFTYVQLPSVLSL